MADLNQRGLALGSNLNTLSHASHSHWLVMELTLTLVAFLYLVTWGIMAEVCQI